MWLDISPVWSYLQHLMIFIAIVSQWFSVSVRYAAGVSVEAEETWLWLCSMWWWIFERWHACTWMSLLDADVSLLFGFSFTWVKDWRSPNTLISHCSNTVASCSSKIILSDQRRGCNPMNIETENVPLVFTCDRSCRCAGWTSLWYGEGAISLMWSSVMHAGEMKRHIKQSNLFYKAVFY